MRFPSLSVWAVRDDMCLICKCQHHQQTNVPAVGEFAVIQNVEGRPKEGFGGVLQIGPIMSNKKYLVFPVVRKVNFRCSTAIRIVDNLRQISFGDGKSLSGTRPCTCCRTEYKSQSFICATLLSFQRRNWTFVLLASLSHIFVFMFSSQYPMFRTITIHNHVPFAFRLSFCNISRHNTKSYAMILWHGGVVERPKTAVLKTAGAKAPVGSNPTPSATIFLSLSNSHSRLLYAPVAVIELDSHFLYSSAKPWNQELERVFLVKEIERKFVVSTFPVIIPKANITTETVEQFYLAIGNEELRVRATTPVDTEKTTYELTLKKGAGLIREEQTIRITEETYSQLRNMSGNVVVKKRRQTIEWKGFGKIKEFILDIYEGSLEGLAVAEVEFFTEKNARRWPPPAWLGTEVTGREELKNQTLWTNLSKGFKTVVTPEGEIHLKPMAE